MSETAMQLNLFAFVGGGECPVQYYLTFAGRDYYVRYRSGLLSVDVDFATFFEQPVGDDDDHDWNDEETTLYLGLISEAIRTGDVAALQVPSIAEAQFHLWYQRGPLPVYIVGSKCIYITNPQVQPLITSNRHARKRFRQAGGHIHSDGCFHKVRACDVQQWLDLHPEDHQAFQISYPRRWTEYERPPQSSH
jgi:hypothetical protein